MAGARRPAGALATGSAAAAARTSETNLRVEGKRQGCCPAAWSSWLGLPVGLGCRQVSPGGVWAGSASSRLLGRPQPSSQAAAAARRPACLPGAGCCTSCTYLSASSAHRPPTDKMPRHPLAPLAPAALPPASAATSAVRTGAVVGAAAAGTAATVAAGTVAGMAATQEAATGEPREGRAPTGTQMRGAAAWCTNRGRDTCTLHLLGARAGLCSSGPWSCEGGMQFD